MCDHLSICVACHPNPAAGTSHILWSCPPITSYIYNFMEYFLQPVDRGEKNQAEFTHSLSTESGLLWSCCPIQRWPQKKMGKRNLIKGKI